jgi:MFS family permease
MQESGASRFGNTRDRAAAIRTLVGACIGMFFNPSSLLILPFGVYQLPIVADTGWDKTVIASSIGTTVILVGFMPPVIGWLTNHFGPRRLITFGFPLCGVALMLLATPTSATLFAVTIAFCGVLASGQILIPFVYSVSGWFDERRGLALGLILACTGLSIAIIPPLAAHLIVLLGWRGTYLGLGAFVFVVGLPVARWLIVDPPVMIAGTRAVVPGVSWRESLGMRSLWLLMGSILLVGGAVSAGAINLYVILVDRGISAVRASFVMSFLGVSMICARLVVGYLLDLAPPQWIAACISVIAATAFWVLATFPGPSGVLVAAVLLGIAFGAEGDVLSYMTSRAFGMRDFGVIFGVVFLSFTLGGGLGPVLFARLKHRTGDYQAALWLAVVACGLAALLVLLIRKEDLPFLHHAQRRRSKGADGVIAEA